MCLPKYCWVCCFNCSIDSGAKFFSIFRLIIAILQILTTLEELFSSKTQHLLRNLEHYFHEEINNILKQRENDGVNIRDSDVSEVANLIWTITMLLMAIGIMYALIELIVSSLAIHGMRRCRPKMLLPYIIWTSFLVFISLAAMVILVGFIIFLVITGVAIEAEAWVAFIPFFITFGLIFGWLLWDLLIMSSRYKQLKNAIGMDHMMLQEVPNDEKEKMLYPQLT